MLVQIPSRARAVCKKCHLSGSKRWIWRKLVPFSETQYRCTLTDMLCSLASKLPFWLISLPGGSGLQKWDCQLRYVKFEDSWWRSAKHNIGVSRRKCSAVSFQTLILVETRARAVWKKCHLSGSIRWIWRKLVTFSGTQYWCAWADMRCSSASKLSFWLISLPGESGLQK